MDMEYVLDRPEASAPGTNQVQQSGAGAVQGPQQTHTHTAQHTPPQQPQPQQQQQPSRCPYFRGAHQHHGQHQHHHQNHQNHYSLPPPHHTQFTHPQLISHPHQSRLQSQAQTPVVGFLPHSPNQNNSPPHPQPVAHYHYHYDPASNLWYPTLHWSHGLPSNPPVYHHQTITSSETFFASSSENPGQRQALFSAGSGSGSGAVGGGSGVAGLGLLQSQPPPVIHHSHPNTFPPLVLTRPPVPGDGTFAPVLFTGPPPALPFPGVTPLMPSQSNHQVNNPANNANNNQSSVNPASSYSAVQQLQQTTLGVSYTAANMPSSGGLSSNFTTSRWATVSDREGRENENGVPLADATTSPSPSTFSGGSPPPTAPSVRPDDEFMPGPTARPDLPPQPWATAPMTRPGPRQGSAESDEYMTAPGSDSAQPDESTTAPRAALAEPGESMAAPRSESSDPFGRAYSELWGPAPMTQAPRPRTFRSDSSDEDEDEAMPTPAARSGSARLQIPASLPRRSEQFARVSAQSQPVTITRSDSAELDGDEDNAMPVPTIRPDPSGQFGRFPPGPWGPASMNRPDPPELPAPSAAITRPDSSEPYRQLPTELWGPHRTTHTSRATEGRRATMSRHAVPPPADSDYDSDEDLDQLEEDDQRLRFIEQFSVSGDFPRDMGESQVRAHQILRGQVPNRRVVSRDAISQLERVEIGSLEESERTCVICYNEYGVKNPEGLIEEPLRLPRCKHMFGANCIKKWFTQSDTCPYCRDRLESEPVIPSSAHYMRAMYRQYQARNQGQGPNGHSARTLPMSIGDVNIRIVPHIGGDARPPESMPPRGSQTGERRSPPSEASESRRRTRPRYSGFRASPSAAVPSGNRQSSSHAGGSTSIAPPQPSPARDRYSRQRPYSFHHTPRRSVNMGPLQPAEPPRGPRPPAPRQPVGSYMGDDGAAESYLNHQNYYNNQHQNRPTLFGAARGLSYLNPAGLPGPPPGSSTSDQPPNPATWSQ